MTLVADPSLLHSSSTAAPADRADYRVRLVGTLPVLRAVADVVCELVPGLPRPPLATVIVPSLPGLSIAMMRVGESGRGTMRVTGRFPDRSDTPYSQWCFEITAFVDRLRRERPDLFEKFPDYVEDIR